MSILNNNIFSNIIGYDSIKNELLLIIDMFKNHKVYEKAGAKLCKGVLLSGAPGLGKTLFAESIIKECGVRTIKLNALSAFDSKEAEDTLELIKISDAAIVLIDDVDKIDSDDYGKVQCYIDSYKDYNVLTIMTANTTMAMPSSLLRSGRIDKHIKFDYPNKSEAKQIMAHYLSNKNINPNINLDDLEKMICFKSCAELQTLINEAASYSVYERKDQIDIEDFTKAYLLNIYKQPEPICDCSLDEIYKTALHEAGHIAVSEYLKENSVAFACVRVCDIDKSNGMTSFCSDLNNYDIVLRLLAGKVTMETLYKGKYAAGCYSDLSKAVEQIKINISEYGYLGLDSFVDNHYSETPIAQVKIKIQSELYRYIEKTREIIIKNKEFIFKLANHLKENRVLYASDIQKIKLSCN